MGSSKSSSSSKSTQTTTTQTYDQRTSAADFGVAIGSGATIEGSIQQIPPEVGDFVGQLLNANERLVTIATNAGDAAIQQADDSESNLQRLVVLGVIAVVVIILVVRSQK